jgi:hypothetical protein
MDAGYAFGRGDMALSVEILLKNTRLERIANAADSASVLRAIATIAETGSGPLRADDYRAIARQYSAARDELRRAFLLFPAPQQQAALELTRAMRASDQERIRRALEEEAQSSASTVPQS